MALIGQPELQEQRQQRQHQSKRRKRPVVVTAISGYKHSKNSPVGIHLWESPIVPTSTNHQNSNKKTDHQCKKQFIIAHVDDHSIFRHNRHTKNTSTSITTSTTTPSSIKVGMKIISINGISLTNPSSKYQSIQDVYKLLQNIVGCITLLVTTPSVNFIGNNTAGIEKGVEQNQHVTQTQVQQQQQQGIQLYDPFSLLLFSPSPLYSKQPHTDHDNLYETSTTTGMSFSSSQSSSSSSFSSSLSRCDQDDTIPWYDTTMSNNTTSLTASSDGVNVDINDDEEDDDDDFVPSDLDNTIRRIWGPLL